MRLLLAAALLFSAGVAIGADESLKAVQSRLKAEGFYFGPEDGTFSAETSAAVSRYQIRNGLPISGHLDAETKKALGVATPASDAAGQKPSGGAWRQLRKSDERFLEKLEDSKEPPAEVATDPAAPANPTVDKAPVVPGAQTAPATTAGIVAPPGAPAVEIAPPGATAPAHQATPRPAPKIRSAPPPVAEEVEPQAEPRRKAGASRTIPAPPKPVSRNTERLRDYVGAYVLAGLDPAVGSELEFFAERVDYFGDDAVPRDRIRKDLERYNERWPDRRFWLAGDVQLEPQSNGRVQVTFPLRFELRNRAERSSGEVLKTLVLEPSGNDYQIISVNERKRK
jgi:peptidoglycan hydrolase-like protein with peptidoglycan-binding domain